MRDRVLAVWRRGVPARRRAHRARPRFIAHLHAGPCSVARPAARHLLALAIGYERRRVRRRDTGPPPIPEAADNRHLAPRPHVSHPPLTAPSSAVLGALQYQPSAINVLLVTAVLVGRSPRTTRSCRRTRVHSDRRRVSYAARHRLRARLAVGPRRLARTRTASPAGCLVPINQSHASPNASPN